MPDQPVEEAPQLTPEQRHTIEVRKREKVRFETQARVEEQILPQLRDAGLA